MMNTKRAAALELKKTLEVMVAKLRRDKCPLGAMTMLINRIDVLRGRRPPPNATTGRRPGS